ncbi:hypothetical protein [Candidatus Pristimantibacillus sp. PTI5]|uniref:hypothetical protein n=1 Tax=Candidatus Pristimantibacillus sp. PTI5 TaxID=3400422 RepID=UPI003B022DA4
MKGIPNPEFWTMWKQKEYKKALQLPLYPQSKSTGIINHILFGNKESLQQAVTTSSLTVANFIYDYCRLDPTVMEGIDFARAEDLSSLFTFSQFANEIDLSGNTGDVAQLQGYVAERMVAAELQSKGHEVEFPETSNQAGYDLLVDGEPFQVKNLLTTSGVKEHLEKYPDIPVYVNAELADQFANNPMVYVTTVQHDEVLKATKETLMAGSDLLDFEIPYISLFVSTMTQSKKLLKSEISLGDVSINVVTDTTSRIVMGKIGQHTVAAAGLLLFGPAGGLVGSGVGVIVGASQGSRISSTLRSLRARTEEVELDNAMKNLSQTVSQQVDRKKRQKEKKFKQMSQHLQSSEAGSQIKEVFRGRVIDEVQYLEDKKREIHSIASQTSAYSPLECVKPMVERVLQTGVHPKHYQNELRSVIQKLRLYSSKL